MMKVQEITIDNIKQANMPQNNYMKTPEILAILSMILWVYITITSSAISLLYGSYGTLLFGIICALIAKKKNRSLITWFACGAWFAILALIILICLKKIPEAICPFCQKEISTQASICPYCKSIIND